MHGLLSLLTVCLDLALTGAPSYAQAPVPPSNPAVADRVGYQEGQAPGAREGAERGASEGDRDGRQAGYSAGYRYCEGVERHRYHDLGYRDGFLRGENEGEYAGRLTGTSDGSAIGARDGEADGLKRSDADAYREAAPLGRRKGEEEADRSDAAEKGRAEGLAAGEREARERALETDYPRGRRDARNRRYAEPVDHEDAFSQRGEVSGAAAKLVQRMSALAGVDFEAAALGHDASPDYRYSRPSRRYYHPEDNRAYLSGYDRGYRQGFYSAYKQCYEPAYRRAYEHAYPLGCQAGKSQDFSFDYRRGYESGHRDGYSRGYDRAYAPAYQRAYAQSFSAASGQAYQRNYPEAYRRHYETARAEAYRRHYREIYDSEHERARRARFNEVYPRYADQEYARGVLEEERDFVERPVRLLAAEVTETNGNGLYEPGETLRVRVALRNFAAAPASAQSVRVSVETLDAGSAVVSVSEEALARDLRGKSRTLVRDALEIRLTEAAANRAVRFRVSAAFDGKSGGTETLEVTGRFAVAIEFAEAPVLREGFEQPVKLRVRNQSRAPIEGGFALSLRSDPRILEVTRGDAAVGTLAAGAERVVEFAAIARVAGLSARFPFTVSAAIPDGRRVGLLEETREVPVLNDYKIDLATDLSALRKAGILRARYVIRNVSSRYSQKSLQLLVRVGGPQAAAFEVVGPNPQYLRPIPRGGALEFVIPVLARSDNAGGELELEVRESGQAVVIHKAAF